MRRILAVFLSLICFASLAASSPAVTKATAKLGEIHDIRDSQCCTSGLEVELIFSGPILSKARSIRNIDIQEATDDTGANLIQPKKDAAVSVGFEQTLHGEEEVKQVLYAVGDNHGKPLLWSYFDNSLFTIELRTGDENAKHATSIFQTKRGRTRLLTRNFNWSQRSKINP